MSLQQNVLIVCGCRGQVQLFRIEMEKYKVERMVSWSEKSMEWLKEQLIVSLDFLPIYGVDIDVDASCFLIYGHYYILLVHWNHLEEVIENTIDHSESRRWNKTWNPNANEEQRSSVIQRIHKLPTKKLKVMYPLENVAYVGFMRQEKGKQQPTDNTIPILCLEHRWEDMLSQMPPALLQKKFGI